jgi:hypothetical protein
MASFDRGWIAGGLVLGLVISGEIGIRAQEDPSKSPPKSPRASDLERGQTVAPAEVTTERRQTRTEARDGRAGSSLQDAVLRPYRFPFARPTSLEQVCEQLRQTLRAPVVLDRAALDRQQVEPDDTVQLELDGVRLKTGLKLLLDQVGLTYQIVAEDNLLIITDRSGAEDPVDKILSELSALHRDVHDLQDAVDELRDIVGLEKGGDGPRVRKPTIIEEMPEEPGASKGVPTPERPGPPLEKPRAGAAGPSPGSRSDSPRVPLSTRGKARHHGRDRVTPRRG